MVTGILEKILRNCNAWRNLGGGGGSSTVIAVKALVKAGFEEVGHTRDGSWTKLKLHSWTFEHRS